MSDQILNVTQKTPNLVNREHQLSTIRDALFPETRKCHIVFMYGEGGMGKSRLAEEVLWRGGNPLAREKRQTTFEEHPDWDWSQNSNTLFGNLIDLTDISLHTRIRLMTAIRNAIMDAVPQESDFFTINFTDYDNVIAQLENIQELQGDYQFIQSLREEAESIFFRDYQANAQSNRIVLLFDTAEKLFAIGAEWLYGGRFLQPEDLGFSAYQWLAEQVRKGGFDNTTLIFIGRKEEGKLFFNLMRDAVDAAGELLGFSEIELGPFGLEDTGTYIREWIEANEFDPAMKVAVETLKPIRDSKEKLKVLWLYTGGQPVRLSLYTDVIVEGIDIPDPLKDSLEEAVNRTKTPDPKQLTPELEAARWEIENEFVRLLFVSRPNLRAQLLKALVRCPRGLDADQLQYLLGSKFGQPVEEWMLTRDENSLSLIDLKHELTSLRNLSIVKVRPDGRIGLQDEMYRIYAQHMRTDEERHDEIKARKTTYQKLSAWAQYWLNQNRRQRELLQAEDLLNLRPERPSQAYTVRFPELLEHEEKERRDVRRDIQRWELEALHYSLLIDPPRNINYMSFELADKLWLANDEEGGAIAEEEEWQVLTDPYALDLIEMESWDGAREGKETPQEILRRVAEQSHVIRWIKRFVLRKKYARAINFWQEVEEAIPDLFADSPRALHSWQHTLSESERKIWVNYAKILANETVEEAIESLGLVASKLETLLSADQAAIVFPEKGEKGFRGHPAEDRVKRVIAQAYNYRGYGFFHKGHSNSGIENYGKALRYLREIKSPVREATTRNNLSAVLSQRGYARARRLCLDGLNLRKQEGAEVPIGYSYNTLALIDNDNSRPDLAWVEASIAWAYFNRAQDSRGQGLALLEMGQALRRLAGHGDTPGYTVTDRRESIYREAERALNQAIHLFTKTSAKEERARLVEVYIEKGCLERDLILFDNNSTHRQVHYQGALRFLSLAIDLAEKLNRKHLKIDALVNKAWAHFYANNLDEAEETLQQTESLLPSDALIGSYEPYPKPKRDDLYVYQQLSKMYALRGHMAMRKFLEQHNVLGIAELDRARRHEVISEDPVAKSYLQNAATSFVLGLAYSQLFSPRSNALTLIYNVLYEYLKEFNAVEMDNFARYEHQAREKYRIAELQFSDLGNLDEFLRDCFGVD